MTFRNDHDAALARVDALERENRRLADENAKLRTSVRDPRPVVWPAIKPAPRARAVAHPQWFSNDGTKDASTGTRGFALFALAMFVAVAVGLLILL